MAEPGRSQVMPGYIGWFKKVSSHVQIVKVRACGRSQVITGSVRVSLWVLKQYLGTLVEPESS